MTRLIANRSVNAKILTAVALVAVVAAIINVSDLRAAQEQQGAPAQTTADPNKPAEYVGSSTCQGCHLTIPATEVARIKKSPEGTISHCDNCGAILVP